MINEMANEGASENGLDNVLDDFEELGDTIYDSPDFDELKERTFDLKESVSTPTTPFGTDSGLDESAYTTTFSANELAGSAETWNAEVDLYDSGASQHMSGFRHKFIDIINIDPLPITAADKRTFQATAKGKMLIILPNGDNEPTHV